MVNNFASLCLSFDLEVGRKDNNIYNLAAVRGDSGESITMKDNNQSLLLAQLDKFASGSTYLLGHNIISFDIPHIAAVNPNLQILKLPCIDTLMLNPLAFPRNPYHHLVKHYQDGSIVKQKANDPEMDSRIALELFKDQYAEFQKLIDTAPEMITAWHWLTTLNNNSTGFNDLFSCIRGLSRPTDSEALASIQYCLRDKTCITAIKDIVSGIYSYGWEMSYTLAWVSVAGTNSLLSPWVGHKFPETNKIIKRLRDNACDDPQCNWCNTYHDATKELTRWFGFPDFRPEPADENGEPLQKVIIETAMKSQHVLGILPTGTGKSLCYQIPALSRYDKTGALTVVISPLTALMADQITGLERSGITSCVAINGLLSMPERSDALNRIRLGDISILIISPEQLRSSAVQNALKQRYVGTWVLDEVHCLSKWGQDFRPDYRYIGRFIKEYTGNDEIATVLCLTATAKTEVIKDIIFYFNSTSGIQLKLYNGGASRNNLNFFVIPTTKQEKFNQIYQLLLEELPPGNPGGAIIYCATRNQTKEIADYLLLKEVSADYFHAGRSSEEKKSIQKRFIDSDLQVIVSTNAFGMGIDKPDVRLVIHADIPGSLENYLQETGRAGRDRNEAKCILLYTPEDVEQQFKMSASSRLTLHDIQNILKFLRKLDKKMHHNGEVVATSGEILLEDEELEFNKDSMTDDTRVRTAISWLEEAKLLTRNENKVQIFPASLRVNSIDDAKARLGKFDIPELYKTKLLDIVFAIIRSNKDSGISTDELMGITGFKPDGIRKALHDLEQLGISSDDTELTAFVHVGVENSSDKRYIKAVELEVALINEMQEAAPDLMSEKSSPLYLRRASQRLKDAGHSTALPERLMRIIKGIASDSHGEKGGKNSIRYRKIDMEVIMVTLQHEWSEIIEIAQTRRDVANTLLNHLIKNLPTGSRGIDLMSATSLGKLTQAIESDLTLNLPKTRTNKILEQALLWLHDQEIIRLGKGLAIFRPAMTIQLSNEPRNFIRVDFQPLDMHYKEKIIQIHVMMEYVLLGLKTMTDALRLAMDYFILDSDTFIQRWLPDRKEQLELQTTPESWEAIIGSLNPTQQRIVADDRISVNMLILAGPGSGKTRVLVHRIAYLVRVKRENPRGIIALAYNRHAAVEIRKRLKDLIGDDAKGIIVMTCHALAMRLAGVSLEWRTNKAIKEDYEELLRNSLIEATALLRGEGLTPDDADEQRDRLLAGFRWILVDEYQDIEQAQYDLISALAGRTMKDDNSKLSLFAVGDDDQNIYSFNGASVKFIRKFEEDYSSKPVYLTENYRSTANIINTSNLVITSANNRMKSDNPITINRDRKKDLPGGKWQDIDPVGRGRVQILSVENDNVTQAIAVMAELVRLSNLVPDWDWKNVAVVAREWAYLKPVRSYCEIHNIPVQMADDNISYFWRLRETQTLLNWLKSTDTKLINGEDLIEWLINKPDNSWWQLLREAVNEYTEETNNVELPVEYFTEWLAEWGHEIRRRQSGLLLLTAHRAKGLEFDHVAVLDGGWDKTSNDEDHDATRRLYYVAMTRAKKTLTLMKFNKRHPILDQVKSSMSLFTSPPAILPPASAEYQREYRRLKLKEIDIGFAGRYQEYSPVHRAISSLTTGSELTYQQNGEKHELFDSKGCIVNRLSQSFSIPPGQKIIKVSVAAIVIRKREDSLEVQENIRNEKWEIVVPEIIYEPDEKVGK